MEVFKKARHLCNFTTFKDQITNNERFTCFMYFPKIRIFENLVLYYLYLKIIFKNLIC